MPMIRRVTLKNFKRFADVTFDVPGHLVLAGPNNTGKTTLLQAIAAWSLGWSRWQLLGHDGNARRGFPFQEIERAQFSAVALRAFDMLWTDREHGRTLSIAIAFDGMASECALEFQFKAPGLAEVRPRSDFPVRQARSMGLALVTTFIPAIAGLSREERRLADVEAIHDLLAQARAGEVLRNLLVLAHQDSDGWATLNEAVGRMFGLELLPPVRGAELQCDYRRLGRLQTGVGPTFDIASAGSGVLQVLLVLALMVAQQGSILLIDEPDAHLHLILQKSIYGELRRLAAQRGSQLIIATHSEQVLESVDPRELCLMYGTPRLVSDRAQKDAARKALGYLSHGDLLACNGALGVIYCEDVSDFDILEAFARVLGDTAALKLLTAQVVRKHARAPSPDGLGDLEPVRHWEMLKLIEPGLRAVELLDGDAKNKADQFVSGLPDRMQRLRWRRYEIESYLLSPGPWERFLADKLGDGAPRATAAAFVELDRVFEPSFREHPMTPTPLQERALASEPVSKTVIPAMLQAAGLNRFAKSSFFEVASHFKADEIHPEVIEKLQQLRRAFASASDPTQIIAGSTGERAESGPQQEDLPFVPKVSDGEVPDA
jgi:hypothetical protein